MTAFTCMAEARRQGVFSVLVADDQIFLSKQDGAIIAACPPAIAGLIELRGTGIVKHDHIAEAEMHFAILPASPTGENRLPADGETVVLAEGFELPVLRLLPNLPLPLAVLMAKAPEIGS
ncbi:serine kinase of HPr protein (carbohydrate metabolism regulator) [Rhizobium viscosum]|uniref:Serine kinase of HPr protein (Carbohydrate metabolism regulator) n=2 Tax=Rhizobium viscosum TaxID=1673 RepID=A0ABR9INA7_RHIVS|nr:serine kinase of HPr protein (carbohydrate metabolism regulator) [Rhizobium viscosum]